MMHGYLATDADGNLLVPFRTWRNTTTGEAAEILTKLFDFNVPLRWSVAHLYQAILNGESHVKDIANITTLAGYVHRKLTGRQVLGVGDASGMFPVNSADTDYDAKLVSKFDEQIADKDYAWKLRDILPQVLSAGDDAGALTPEGAAWIDPSGALEPGIPLCPPEGDAGTGMVATNSVSPRSGNISAGTSIFAMIVLERSLAKVSPEIDMVTTPTGSPVAMVHCNNGTSEIDAWATVFRGFAEAVGMSVDDSALYDAVYGQATRGDADAGGLIVYNYLAGEPITGLEQGRPIFVRTPESRLSFANFMQAQFYSAVATLKIGMEILDGESVKIDRIVGHGGFFKTGDSGARVMALALGVPVSVMTTAGEGGAWGIALLASYRASVIAGGEVSGFGEYLEEVFARVDSKETAPDKEAAEGFAAFLARYKEGLAIERAAILHS
jgi:sugar (pentulose or hexulose) kinase